MNNNSKEELKGNEFNRLLLVPCEEKLLIGECAASAEYKVNVACKKTTVPCSDDTESIARKILMRAKTCALAAELQKWWNMFRQLKSGEG